MENIKYIGCFFDPETLAEKLVTMERTFLFRKIPAPHVTFVYAPVQVPEELFGETITVTVIGYGNNGENEALLVMFSYVPDSLKALAAAIPVPHITLSVSENGSSVNSKDLAFRNTAPFTLTGVFGAMDMEGHIYTQAPNLSETQP